MLALVIAPLVAAATVLAFPAASNLNSKLVPQSTPGPWCDGLGAGVFDVALNFSLAAYNTSLPNANTTGAPLVFGQAGAVDGAEFKVFSTFASFPFNDFPTMSLLHGGLEPNGDVSGSNANVTAGAAPGFIITNLDLPAPVPIYCAIADTDPNGGGTGFPELAVFSDPDNFSLCSSSTFPNAQTNVVYKPTADNFGEYILESCYPVRLQLIGLNN